MMDIGILHTHHLIIVLYGLYILLSGGVLWYKQAQYVESFRKKSRVLRIVLEALLFLTGLYLLFRSPIAFSFPFLLKYALLLLSVFLLIFAYKEKQFYYAFASFLIFLYLYGLSRTHDFLLRTDEKKIAILRQQGEVNGPILYEVFCYRCHGEGGKGGYLKSPDLTQSPNLSNDAYLNHILENGKGVMPSFRFLNAQEREALIRYLRKL